MRIRRCGDATSRCTATCFRLAKLRRVASAFILLSTLHGIFNASDTSHPVKALRVPEAVVRRVGSAAAPIRFKSLLELRILDRLRQIFVLLATRAADGLDGRELRFGQINFALDHIGFAEILANLRVIRVERAGL
jgi:hypothetical protein